MDKKKDIVMRFGSSWSFRHPTDMGSQACWVPRGDSWSTDW